MFLFNIRSNEMSKKLPLIVGIWFYIGWFSSVLLGQKGLDLYSLFFPLISWILIFQIYKPLKSLLLLFGALCFVGLGFDLLMGQTDYAQIVTNWGHFPIWLLSIWLLFVSILPLLENLFKGRLFIAGLLGAILGPFNYITGEYWEVFYLYGSLPIIFYALFWALYFPLSLKIISNFLHTR